MPAGYDDAAGQPDATPHPDEMVASLNPNLGATDALLYFQNDELTPAITKEDPHSPNWDYMLRWDDSDEDVWEEELDPTLPAEPLFLVRNEENRQYQSMTAWLGYEDAPAAEGDERRALAILDTVVDSGAAYCAMSLDCLRQHFPNHHAQMRATDKRFTDASGNLMPAAGVVDFTIRLGDCRLRTSMYIIRRLGVPVLLGTNALMTNGLVINAHKRLLYVDPDLCGDRSCEAVLQCERADGNLHCVFDTAPGECAPCETSTAHLSPWTSFSCNCNAAYTVDADIERRILIVRSASHTSTPSETHVDCEEGDASATETHRLRSDPWTTTLKASRDYMIKAGQKGKGLLLDYSEPCPNPHAKLAIRPLPQFLEKQPHLQTLEEQMVGAHNKQAFLHVTNSSKRGILIKKGTELARVKMVPKNRASMGDSQSPPGSILRLEFDEKVPFEEGGPPRTDADIDSIEALCIWCRYVMNCLVSYWDRCPLHCPCPLHRPACMVGPVSGQIHKRMVRSADHSVVVLFRF